MKMLPSFVWHLTCIIIEVEHEFYLKYIYVAGIAIVSWILSVSEESYFNGKPVLKAISPNTPFSKLINDFGTSLYSFIKLQYWRKIQQYLSVEPWVNILLRILFKLKKTDSVILTITYFRCYVQKHQI